MTNRMPKGSVEIPNSAGLRGYFGMCPPAGRHHLYRITIFARDVVNTDETTFKKADLVIASLMADGHTLGVAESVSIFPAYRY